MYYKRNETEKMVEVFKGQNAHAKNGGNEWSTDIEKRLDLTKTQIGYLTNLHEVLPFPIFAKIGDEFVEKFEALTSDWRDDEDYVQEQQNNFLDWIEGKVKPISDLNEPKIMAIQAAMILTINNVYPVPFSVEM